MSEERKMDRLQNMYRNSEACGCFVALDDNHIATIKRNLPPLLFNINILNINP